MTECQWFKRPGNNKEFLNESKLIQNQMCNTSEVFPAEPQVADMAFVLALVLTTQ